MREQKSLSPWFHVDPTWGDTCRRIDENAEYWTEVERLLGGKEA